ncbi:hypothetical protein CUROG_03150 [Corynebacterium urogenitale]|uniref:Secreted protein n=1 Tax=Corynebacterium urogenitale TaxID=2487892 RepID=A0A5J6Z8Q9_9CORY|nr:LppP/LprE family lipoprotein [Corynebacterium urogenitale]QFQ02013.1 hypothetical protein CUROG_03150 [Corynebacterium urogenitale]
MTTRGFFTTRRLSAASITLTLACSIAACGDNGSDYEYSASFTPQTSSTPSQKTSSNTPASQARNESERTTSSRSPEPTQRSQEERSGNCGVNTQATEIYDHISDVPDNGLFEGNEWKYDGQSNYDPCVDLSYASLYQEGTHASTPSQLMLFHRGEYLGVGSDQLLNPIKFLEVTDSSIKIRYKDWKAWSEAGASFAESPNYYTDITYRWDGEKVQMLGHVPES